MSGAKHRAVNRDRRDEGTRSAVRDGACLSFPSARDRQSVVIIGRKGAGKVVVVVAVACRCCCSSLSVCL